MSGRRFKTILFSLATAALLFVLPATASAAILWGTDATGELVGSRDSASGGGIAANGPWDNGNFSVSWVVAESDGTWTYSYTVTGYSKAISHFILEVTQDLEPFAILPGSSSPILGPTEYSSANSGNPDMPNPIYGIKFDYAAADIGDWKTAVYTIVTDRAPVYGVFYGKDGKDAGDFLTAWSTALDFADYKTNENLAFSDFLVRPNGSPVPIPGAVWLLGSGLLCLIGIHRHFSRM